MTKRKRRPKSKIGKARVVKLSPEVYNYIIRGQRRKYSIDAALRKLLGLQDRKGNGKPLRKFYVLKKPITAIFEKLAVAKGEAIVRAVQTKQERVEKPIRVQEVR